MTTIFSPAARDKLIAEKTKNTKEVIFIMTIILSLVSIYIHNR